MDIPVKHRYIVDPGYIAASHNPAFLCSVCGSGVVLTLWNKTKRKGGMTHCIFDKVAWNQKTTNYHASIAVPALLRYLKVKDAYFSSWEAQIFGGGNFDRFAPKRVNRVVKVIRKLLKKYSIPIVSEDIGGQVGRKVLFNTFSGEILVMKTNRVRRSDWSPEYAVKS